VLGFVDSAHAAFSEQPEDSIVTEIKGLFNRTVFSQTFGSSG
jgi:hypothetical protein